MKRTTLVFPGIAVAAASAIMVLARPAGSQEQTGSPQFEATFADSSDFYDRFDFGYSGYSPWDPPPQDAIRTFHGDHDASCAAPTTLRDVAFGGDKQRLDYSQLFWWCAPGGDTAKGHLMTGVSTMGYNIAWFAPKPLFTGVSKVCWDLNETAMSARKWTQVMFVAADDAVRYPADTTENPAASRPLRGSGGYDLGFTSPDFRDLNGPTTGVHPDTGTLAGYKETYGIRAHWFQDDAWVTDPAGLGEDVITSDKAARFQRCLENQPDNILRITQETPTGVRTFDVEGQIPAGPVRVVFQDDNYNGPKDERYQEDVNTWHWDDIQVFAASVEDGPPAPVTVPAAGGAAADDGDAVDAPATDEVAAPIASSPAADDDISISRGVAVVGLVAMVLLVAVLVLLLVLRPGPFKGPGPNLPPPPQD